VLLLLLLLLSLLLQLLLLLLLLLNDACLWFGRHTFEHASTNGHHTIHTI